MPKIQEKFTDAKIKQLKLPAGESQAGLFRDDRSRQILDPDPERRRPA